MRSRRTRPDCVRGVACCADVLAAAGSNWTSEAGTWRWLTCQIDLLGSSVRLSAGRWRPEGGDLVVFKVSLSAWLGYLILETCIRRQGGWVMLRRLAAIQGGQQDRRSSQVGFLHLFGQNHAYHVAEATATQLGEGTREQSSELVDICHCGCPAFLNILSAF